MIGTKNNEIKYFDGEFPMIMLKWLKVSCKDTSPLISEMMDHSLPLSKRLRLKFHLAICGVCRYYQEHLNMLRTLAQRLGKEETSEQLKVKLSPDAKEKFQQALKSSS